MNEQEFKKANNPAVRAYGDYKGLITYKTCNQLTETIKFFRFSKEKLIQFGEEIYPDDYKSLLFE